MKVVHQLKPIYNEYSKVLVLGSIPSIKSRELNFYYANKKNRFWTTLFKVYNEDYKDSIEDKILFLYKHNIALFDVIKSCEITSSSDSSIKNIIVNDLSTILKKSQIKTIFTIGRKAYNLYQKYLLPKTQIEAIYLPSTSPANCPKNIDEVLLKEFSKIKRVTDN